MYRASGPLDHYDEPRRPERWDRDRFERLGGRDDRHHHEEYDRGFERDRGVSFAEPDRYSEDDRYARRPDFTDRPDTTSQALQPYTRRKSVAVRDDELARPRRPTYLRRQSSLDTFDRRPLPRYEDPYRPPRYVDLPLPYRKHDTPTPPRQRYREHREEIIVGPRDERYRDVSIHRSKSKRRKSRAPSVSSIGSSSSSEGSSPPVVLIGKRGKTRMPKRLVRKEAIVQMGLPYEEETDFFIVRRALAKEHIDEAIKISETIKTSNGNKKTTTTYKYEKGAENRSPPQALPPPPVAVPAPPVDHGHVHSIPPHPGMEEVITRKFVEEDHHHDHHLHDHHHHDGALVIREPPRPKSDREIREEIRALESERRALQRERDTEKDLIIAERVRDRDYDYDHHHHHHHHHDPRDREVLRVEKDSRVRSRSRRRRRADPKALGFAVSTLT
ncbi:hypothetical protein P152DRAFT_481327 [Eremomyces bilateralis CBS 781.70]|uniref:DUF8035 domain-containing protein n=1 Tax=Eremomyces bilateralis CBS 781.70 TaxID=1392243 RepID=A0A6G1G539_9PEZI|nr:uncharacterized protein P152DRAFT_481327 [Eremomyces bilateralis CBS 781.70]KAF1813205.1 hypothetical protein P152DRAFT_481327 [Eremomyces bilateralis CBS 781.70]